MGRHARPQSTMHQLPPPNHQRERERATITYHGGSQMTFSLREVVWIILAFSLAVVAISIAILFLSMGTEHLAGAVDRLMTALMRPLATLGWFLLALGFGGGFLLLGLSSFIDSWRGQEPANEEWREE